MCDPAAAVMVVSMVVGAYSSHEQGQAQKSAARFNARESENEAVRTRNKGVEEEVKHRQKVAQLISRQRAQLGASNVDLNTGSAFDIQEDARILGDADALRIRSNFEDQSGSLSRSADLINFQGDAAARAGNISAAGSLISAAGKGVSSNWYNSDSAAVTTNATNADINQFGSFA